MAHLAPAPAAADAMDATGIASVGLAVLEPELLVHALLFVDHAEAIRTASTCKALRSTLLGPWCMDAGYLWRSSYRRRWLFGLRRRHRPPQQQQQASSSSSSEAAASAPALGQDFLAYRTRHEQARRMAEGKAGQYRVQTVRPTDRGSNFNCFLLESETEEQEADAGEGAEGPMAYVGTSTGQVMRVGFPPQQPDGGEWAFGPMWEASVLQPRESVTDIAREGNVLACGTGNGRVFFLHAGTGQPLPRAGESAAPGDPFVIDTGLDSVAHLLWLEGGKRLAVASDLSDHVHLYCPRTGRLCQDIGPPEGAGANPDADLVRALVRRQEEGAQGRAGQRPHFLALYWSIARFFVQDTAAETPDADSTDFRPYSEHGRTWRSDAPFAGAVFAPVVGGFPSDVEAGVYRVFFGSRDRGVLTTTFSIHPRIRLAQLFQADGGIVSPLRAVTPAADVKMLQVRSVRVPKPEGGAGSDHALLLGGVCPGHVVVWSLHEPPCQQDGAEEPAFDCCNVITHRTFMHVYAPVLFMDDEKVVVAPESTNLQVLTLPRDPAPYPVSCDPTPVRDRFPECKPLYSLRGGSATLGPSSSMRGVAVGAAEVLVAYNDKLRLYDFSP